MKRTTPHLKIAHRGASGYEPDNTIRAFEKAIELGADMIELDVHLSRDGQPVVIHDAQIDGIAVKDLTVKELKRFNVGKGEQIPTFQEAIDCVKGRCQLYIELKGEDTEPPVVECIRRNGMQREVIIGSFDPTKVRRTKTLAPELMTSVLTGEMEIDFVAFAREALADCIHFCWERHPAPHTLLTDDLMKTCADASLKVLIWHEERPEEIREIVKRGIYGICSDLPELL
jgi:glycerophosphoryl diester phosphodiesterase